MKWTWWEMFSGVFWDIIETLCIMSALAAAVILALAIVVGGAALVYWAGRSLIRRVIL